MNEQFECFVRDVYKPDESIAKWKINKKIETLNYYENKNVTVLFLNIDVSKKVYHKGKKRNVYISAERLKNLLRNKYSKKIQNYFADNIFHMTDDEKEFKELYPIVVSYLDDYNTEKDDNKKRVRRCNRYEV